MEEGKRQGNLATSRQYGNALLGVHHPEEEREDSESHCAFDPPVTTAVYINSDVFLTNRLSKVKTLKL